MNVEIRHNAMEVWSQAELGDTKYISVCQELRGEETCRFTARKTSISEQDQLHLHIWSILLLNATCVLSLH